MTLATAAVTIASELLDRAAWLRAWESLPAECREAYFHPEYVEAAATWEGGRAECLRVSGAGGWMLYPYVRHAVPNGPAGAFDVQTAYGYGGPLFVGEWDRDARVEALREVGRTLSDRGAVAEFVRCHGRWTDVNALRDAGYAPPVVRTNVTCDLTDAPVSDAWAGNVRRNLRRAGSAGLRWRIGTTDADLGAFEHLYALTADRLDMAATYRFDAGYFRGLWQMPRPLVQLVLVETADAKPVAGALVLCGGETAHYHLGGSDFAYQADRPNDLLYLAMAETARAAGCRRICWGGGTSNDPADSLFRFKTGFGHLHEPAHIGCRVLNAPVYRQLVADWERRNPDRAADCRLFLRYRA